jgi:hypothetical protein
MQQKALKKSAGGNLFPNQEIGFFSGLSLGAFQCNPSICDFVTPDSGC